MKKEAKIKTHQRIVFQVVLGVILCLVVVGLFSACTSNVHEMKEQPNFVNPMPQDNPAPAEEPVETNPAESEPVPQSLPKQSAEELRAQLGIIEDYRPSFVHGEKGDQHQKYIMLHDTESESSPLDVINWWDGNGNLIAAHFIVGKDGSIAQCVPMDKIAHHAGFGNAGHNDKYGVGDESRDDKKGTKPIGGWAPDYGMNSHSIGIEMVHVGGSGGYPEAQLKALDGLIAYIDSYYGFESTIIDHKAWRIGNSDTSPEFAGYLANYQTHRTYAP